MTETRQKIFDSNDFVISELKKIQILYELKRIIRYDHKRNHEEHTESDAGHIFGMHCLIDFFLPLEDTEEKLDANRIRLMVQYHEIDEIVTGDKIGYQKTKAEVENERFVAEDVIVKLPEIMQQAIREALDEYDKQTTVEAKFAKAIDKIEPVFHLYNETGRKTLHYLKTTKEQHDRIKLPYLDNFPTIKRFAEVMSEQFKKEGFYTSES